MTGPPTAPAPGSPAGVRIRTTEDDGTRAAAASLAEAVRSFRRSLHIRTVDTGSCAVCESEIRLLTAPHYDLHRLGLFFTPSPRHADLLLVTGPVARGMEVALRKTYDAMPDPKAVVAVGACPLGGVLAPDAWVRGNLDAVLPVDVFVPGCPPSPLALLHGLLVAVGRLAVKTTGDPFTTPAEEQGTREEQRAPVASASPADAEPSRTPVAAEGTSSTSTSSTGAP